MNEEQTTVIMELIVNSGSARSFSMEAIQDAKQGDFESAHKALKNANDAIAKAHSGQTDMIQKAARGEKIELNLFMVHAQDHVMTAILAKDLAQELVELYEKLTNTYRAEQI